MTRISEQASQFGVPGLVDNTGTDYAEAHLPTVVSSMVAETKLTRPGLPSGLLLEYRDRHRGVAASNAHLLQ